MKFDSLLSMIGEHPFFDLATIVQLSGENKATIHRQLSRWIKAGKLIALRRGMYVLATRYRRAAVNAAELAGHLYRPSYLSREWALGFYGLIPESVVTYTSVTPRVPHRFENAFGHFEYRHIKQAAFFGYRVVEIRGTRVMLADPEKALLDLWHLSLGPWTVERMSGMRFQNTETVNPKRLGDHAVRYDSPRLRRAAEVWRSLAVAEQEGAEEL